MRKIISMLILTMIYKIGDIKFRTKQNCEAFVRDKLNKLGETFIDNTHNEFQFFNDLIKNHPESEKKIGKGIKEFIIIRNKNSYGLHLKRVDDSITDCSWLYCCYKKVNHKTNILCSMRYSVRPFITNFRESQEELKCLYCGSDDEIHIDHHEPSFYTLSNTFLSSREYPTEFDDHPTQYFAIFKEADKEYEEAWTEYHNNNCNLQVLCKKCNQSKPKF